MAKPGVKITDSPLSEADKVRLPLLPLLKPSSYMFLKYRLNSSCPYSVSPLKNHSFPCIPPILPDTFFVPDYDTLRIQVVLGTVLQQVVAQLQGEEG